MKTTQVKSLFGIKFLMTMVCFGLLMHANGQERICLSYEYELTQRDKYPELGTIQEFEERFETIINQVKSSKSYEEGVFIIPIIVHIIHDGDAIGIGDNISAALVEAQINQMNYDFRKIEGTSGFNDDPVGADTFIEFAPALIDPNGNLLVEPGINRINRNDMGWSAPPYDGIGSSYIDDIIKPDSYWNPDLYLNFWVMDLSSGLLGYAQFPSSSGLDGLDSNGGLAETDGVVILASSVGGDDLPNPNGGNFDLGRTATHEVGHWLGLRHIWGDGGCEVDDYCADTPESDASNGGCPTGHESCGTVDMIENYMDYTYDACMNIFTEDQKLRMDAVLAISPRRASLATSTVHLAPFPNLIISEVVDGNETGDIPKYIEIHNASEDTYDLSALAIRVFADGASEATATVEIPDATVLVGGESYVVSSTAFDVGWGSDFTAETPDLVDAAISGDGNDAYDLYDNDTGLTIDAFGEVGVNGVGTNWEYTDGIAERKSYVLRPNNGNFSSDNWSIIGYISADASPRTHTAETPANDPSLAGLSGIIDGKTYFACDGSTDLSPVVSVENMGSGPINSVNLSVDDNGSITIVTAAFDPEIQPGETLEYPLSAINVAIDGDLYFAVSIDDESDGNPTNNNDLSVDYSVNIFEDASTLTVETQVDDFPEEISWTISDAEGNVIYEKSTFEAFEFDSEDVCLEDGDYIFALTDSYGDGIADGYGSLYIGEELIVTIPGNHPDFDASPFGADPETIEVAFTIPYVALSDVSVEITSPLNGTLDFCSNSVSLQATFTNEGTTVINSLEISYGLVGNLSTTILDDLFYSPGDFIDFDFGLIDLADGLNSIQVNIVSINGGEDENGGNNGSADVTFAQSDGNAVFVTLSTDSFPEETSWEITDSEGLVVAENGILTANIDIKTVTCLDDGTYIFTLYDSFGDGNSNDIAVLIEDFEDQQVAIIGGGFDLESSVMFTLPFVPFTDMSIEIVDPADSDEIVSCNNEVPVTVFIENMGSVAITSVTLGLEEDVIVFDDILFNVGESGDLELGTVLLVEGSNTITASLLSVNGTDDDEPLNDESSIDVTYVVDETTSAVQVDLHLDDFPSETSWDITDDSGTVLASGGSYFEESVTLSDIACLADGCYNFNLYDSWGDGGPGVDVIVGESTEFSVQAGDWGNQISGTICVGDAPGETPPAAPSGLAATAESSSSISLSWTDNADNEDEYELQRAEASEGPWSNLSTSIIANATSYIDTGLTEEATYYYRLRASNSVGLTAWSNVASATTEELVLGIDYLGDIRVLMFPNPVESMLTISLSENRNIQISVLDYSGRSYQVEIKESGHNLQVDMSKLATGLYFVTLKNGHDELNWRILKK